MGQRTQIVLKTKDILGNVQVKVYHEQQGFKKTMLMLVSQFLLNMCYGDNHNIEDYRKPLIAGKQDLNALSDEEKAKQLEEYNKYSVHNLDMHTQYAPVNHEYEENYINNETGEDAKFNRPLTKEEEKQFTHLLNWDFDIFNPENVWRYRGDNNDGMCLVSVEEKLGTTDWGTPCYDYDVYVGFLNEHRYKGKQYITGAKYLDIFKRANMSDKERLELKQCKIIYNNTIAFTEVKELGIK